MMIGEKKKEDANTHKVERMRNMALDMHGLLKCTVVGLLLVMHSDGDHCIDQSYAAS